MEYKFLEELTDKELEELKSVLLEENKRKEFMMKIEKIKNRKIEIARIYEKNSVNSIFNSNSVPNHDSQLENKCSKVLENILVNVVRMDARLNWDTKCSICVSLPK